jgi:hypothetical protein
MEAGIIVTHHAQIRCHERGGDIRTITAVAKQEAPRILTAAIRHHARRVAIESPEFSVIPILEISHRKRGVRLIVVTVLPRPSRPYPHPTVAV